MRTARDDRRRATHNEVERRRRDKINNWIVKLSKLVPDCTMDQTKQGQVWLSLNDVIIKYLERCGEGAQQFSDPFPSEKMTYYKSKFEIHSSVLSFGLEEQ